jgi:hypothetical protein
MKEINNRITKMTILKNQILEKLPDITIGTIVKLRIRAETHHKW